HLCLIFFATFLYQDKKVGGTKIFAETRMDCSIILTPPYSPPHLQPHPALSGTPLLFKERGRDRGGHPISTIRVTPTGLEEVKF
ncbi:MAG TPA: hypothetical protein PLD12_04440, partial [Bacteroidales bacterium]|nr:hypothetical protein [Bacteroidales bacterium]HPO65345.1 hypothetical protein [Bacteroidales bacterium]